MDTKVEGGRKLGDETDIHIHMTDIHINTMYKIEADGNTVYSTGSSTQCSAVT